MEENFQNIIKDAMKKLDLCEFELALEFTVPKPVITRWVTGETTPHPIMRKHVFAFFESKGYKRGR